MPPSQPPCLPPCFRAYPRPSLGTFLPACLPPGCLTTLPSIHPSSLHPSTASLPNANHPSLPFTYSLPPCILLPLYPPPLLPSPSFSLCRHSSLPSPSLPSLYPFENIHWCSTVKKHVMKRLTSTGQTSPLRSL